MPDWIERETHTMWAVTPNHTTFKAEFTHTEGTRWIYEYDPTTYYEGANVFQTEAEAIACVLRHFRYVASDAKRAIEALEVRLAKIQQFR